ncbi:MAG: hypothetical protein GPJ54_19085 [Candidatus Heimdallarchaeota archaeon]|nr:hypothetical protein [Candidatus Heimdallarchaeota archaeon]
MKLFVFLCIYITISMFTILPNATIQPIKDNQDSILGLDNNLYKQYSNEFLVLTLNLHTYQESNQDEKINMIVDVIGNLEIDLIAFQEAAQYKESNTLYSDIKADNIVYIIAERLKTQFNMTYYFEWDWSHYGWQVWEEGVAILSKYPINHSSSLYVSSATSTSNIQSRKIISSQVTIPNIGDINLISAHLSWRLSETSEEQNNQIKSTKNHVTDFENSFSGYSIVAGDFNGNPVDDPPWNEGYNTMIQGGYYVDSYLEVVPNANTKPRDAIHDTVKGTFPGRIDYIFRKNVTQIRSLASQIIFTPDVVGLVSDHYGVITKFSNDTSEAVKIFTDVTSTVSTTISLPTSTASSIEPSTSSTRGSSESISDSSKTSFWFPILAIFIFPAFDSLRRIIRK